MPNTNPQAVKFTNENVRVFADVVLSAIQTARAFTGMYGANSMDGLFPNDAELIMDGSDVDGRLRVQNQTVRALRTQANDLLTWAATGTPTREDRLRTIAVNGTPRF